MHDVIAIEPGDLAPGDNELHEAVPGAEILIEGFCFSSALACSFTLKSSGGRVILGRTYLAARDPFLVAPRDGVHYGRTEPGEALIINVQGVNPPSGFVFVAHTPD